MYDAFKTVYIYINTITQEKNDCIFIHGVPCELDSYVVEMTVLKQSYSLVLLKRSQCTRLQDVMKERINIKFCYKLLKTATETCSI